MNLHLNELGEGSRTAILVHGLLSDHGAWTRVAPALVERGYKVVMPDLRGHGLSPRGEYSPQSWAGDLVESLPRGVDLAIGHSLGGLSLLLAAPSLAPLRAVYVDPVWYLTAEQNARYAKAYRQQIDWTEAELSAANPRWHVDDVAARTASVRRFDPACIDGLLPGRGHDLRPQSPVTKSLVMLADPSDFVSPADAGQLRRAGFDVVNVPGAGHSIFRDDLPAFLAGLDDWLP